MSGTLNNRMISPPCELPLLCHSRTNEQWADSPVIFADRSVDKSVLRFIDRLLYNSPKYYRTSGKPDHEHRGTGDDLSTTSVLRLPPSCPTID